MQEVLGSQEEYRYLDNNGIQKLRELRQIANRTNILKNEIVPIVKGVFGVFPWLGTKEMLALSFALKEEGIANQIYYRAGIPIFIEIKTRMKKNELEKILKEIKYKEIDKNQFDIPDLLQKTGKYNYMIPKELLKKQFIEDCVDVEGMQRY